MRRAFENDECGPVSEADGYSTSFPIKRLTRWRTPSHATSALGALFDLRRRKPHVPVDIFADPKLQDAYYSAAVLRTEAMLDDVYRKLKATHGAHPIPTLSRETFYIYKKGDPGADFFRGVRGFCGGSLEGEVWTAAAT